MNRIRVQDYELAIAVYYEHRLDGRSFNEFIGSNSNYWRASYWRQIVSWELEHYHLIDDNEYCKLKLLLSPHVKTLLKALYLNQDDMKDEDV